MSFSEALIELLGQKDSEKMVVRATNLGQNGLEIVPNGRDVLRKASPEPNLKVLWILKRTLMR